ncbi:MAG TPA: emopamil-binding family protein [Anaerolineaceae bacterium]
MEAKAIPLSRRPADIAFLLFFLVNILFITYMVDIEQLTIPDAVHFTYPAWPPHAVVDMVHRYGETLDPLLIARPPWWKMTIWIDALLFGPFYLAAIYAFIKARNWIRIPAIIYSSMLITNVLIILSEEIYGPHATPHLPVVFLLNLPWLVFPALLIYRMWHFPHPFTEPVLPFEPVASSSLQRASSTGD